LNPYIPDVKYSLLLVFDISWIETEIITSLSFQIENRKCNNKISIREKEKDQFLGFYVAEYVFKI